MREIRSFNDVNYLTEFPTRRTAVSYVMLATVCMFGGPLVNKIGVKWALVIGAATFPIRGASYYVNSKYGNQWVGKYYPDGRLK